MSEVVSVSAQKAKNDLRKRCKQEPNKKHNCHFCEKQFFQSRFGAHIFNFHIEAIQEKLKGFKKLSNPQAPFNITAGGKIVYFCLVCRGVWDHPQRALSHCKKHPNCTIQNQLQAIYALIDHEPAKPANVFVKEEPHKLYADLREAKETEQTALALESKTRKIFEKKIQGLELELKVAREEKRRAKAEVEEKNFYSHIEIALRQDKIDILVGRLKECKGWTAELRELIENMEISDDDKTQLEKLRVTAGLTEYKTEKFDEPKKIENEIVSPIPAPIKIAPPIPATTTSSIKKCGNCYSTEETDDITTCQICNKYVCVHNIFGDCYTDDCRKCGKIMCKKCVQKIRPNSLSQMRNPHCVTCLTSPPTTSL